MSKLSELLLSVISRLKNAEKQRDWNQNDETQSDFVKGRTHYSETNIVTETREFNATSADGGYIEDLEFAKLLQANYATAKYYDHAGECKFLGANDTCTVFTVSKSSNDFLRWTITLYTDSNGELTGKVLFGDNGAGNFSEGSITIEYKEEVVHQLDEKYIPDTIARTSYVDEAVNSIDIPKEVITVTVTDGGKADKTASEIIELVSAGKVVQLLQGDGALQFAVVDSSGAVMFRSSVPGQLIGDDSASEMVVYATVDSEGTVKLSGDVSARSEYVNASFEAIDEAIATKITAPSTAAVGQTIVVKAVDESGKPVEWESVDLPGDHMEFITSITLESGVSVVSQSLGAKYKKVFILGIPSANAFCSSGTFYIRCGSGISNPDRIIEVPEPGGYGGFACIVEYREDINANEVLLSVSTYSNMKPTAYHRIQYSEGKNIALNNLYFVTVNSGATFANTKTINVYGVRA